MKRAFHYLNALSIAIPVFVLIGWQFNIDFFKRPIANSVVMNPATALGMFIAALSLFLANGNSRHRFLPVARGLAFILVFMACGKLLIGLTGQHLTPLLYRQQLETEFHGNSPNVTSPNALIAVILYGISLMLFQAADIKFRKAANYAAVAVLLIGLFSLIGYMYQVKEYYSIPSFYPMAVHTALCVVLLALALLFANSEVGFMQIISNPNIAGKVARLLIPSTVIIPILLGFMWLYAQSHFPLTGEFGISVLIISFIAVFFSLIWYVSIVLNYGDVARVAAEEELKQKNDALRITEERLLLATEGTTAGIWDWQDVSKDSNWWSPRFYELLGFKNNEMPASIKTLNGLLHPDDSARAVKLMEDHFKKQARFEIEYRLKTKSGAYKWFLATGQAKFESGRASRMVGSIIDIDEQKRVRDIIKQQAELIKMLPDGIVFYSEGMKFADVNDGAERLFDIKRSEVIGKDLGDFITFSMPKGEKFENSLATLWQTGFYRGELQISNRHTGKTVNVLVNIKKMENASGDKPLFMAIYTDLSLLRLNEELSQALKSLKTNNQYLEQFAYISAHDIKAPIITIAGLTDLMVKSDAVKDEHKEILKMLTNSIKQVQRTNHSLNNILKLRKNLMAKDYAADQSFSLQTILDDVKSGLLHEMEESGMTLEANLNDIAELNFMYVYIKSIFYNLLSNAIKYRDPAKPLVVKIECSKINDRQYRFVIEDNGLGIDLDKNKNKMFGIFKRFHTHVEGSGVGLHIVKSIVDEYNGTIEVESAVGKGTKFSLEFNQNILA